MKRNDWVWVFTKMLGIYFLVFAFCSLPNIVQFLSFNYPVFILYLLTLELAFAAGLFLILRTNWMLWLAGIRPEKVEEAEAPAEQVEKPAWDSSEGIKKILWILIKAMGIYFTLLAVVIIPMRIYHLVIALSDNRYPYSLLEDQMFTEAITDFIRLGIGVCLIMFTNFFVKICTAQGLLSKLKDKMKYSGEID